MSSPREKHTGQGNRRREQILKKAALLFGRKGYHATSIADIIKSAGIARGTFYLYFKNKRALFDELLDLLVISIKKAIRRVDVSEGSLPVQDQLSDNIKRVLDLLTQNSALLSILLEGAVGLDKGFDEKLAGFYEQIIETVDRSLRLGQEMEIIRPCNTRMAALTALGGLKEVLHDMLRGPRTIDDLSLLSNQILDVILHGVAA